MADNERASELGRWLAVQEKANEALLAYPDWRRGQALFNALWSIDSALADAIRGTVADPFYNDDRIAAFGDAVMKGATS